MIEDGYLILPRYAPDGQLDAMVFVQALPEHDRDEVLSMVEMMTQRAERRRELGDRDLHRLRTIVSGLTATDDGNAA